MSEAAKGGGCATTRRWTQGGTFGLSLHHPMLDGCQAQQNHPTTRVAGAVGCPLWPPAPYPWLSALGEGGPRQQSSWRWELRAGSTDDSPVSHTGGDCPLWHNTGDAYTLPTHRKHLASNSTCLLHPPLCPPKLPCDRLTECLEVLRSTDTRNTRLSGPRTFEPTCSVPSSVTPEIPTTSSKAKQKVTSVPCQ